MTKKLKSELRKLIKDIDTDKTKGKGPTLQLSDPDFLEKFRKQMNIGKKAGGKVMKMRGGGLATRGTNFSIR